MSIGFNVNGDHFVMNSHNAEIIQAESHYRELGGDETFNIYVKIDPNLRDDIVITDSVDPDASK